MQVKNLMGKKVVRQILSYFCVGGVSALVEWILFAIFTNVVGINYIVATCCAFIFSTATNWALGRVWTFKDNKVYQNKKIREIIMIFSVSAIGLLFNIGLMYIFVTVMRLNTSVLKILSKIGATGIVFLWNFLVRKFVVYK